MAEPATSTTAGIALAGTLTLTGTICGLSYDALMVGFIAGLVSLMHLPPPDGATRTPWQVFTLVASASVMAGIFAPVAVAAAGHYLPWLGILPAPVLRMAAAALIGLVVHLGIPWAFAWVRGHSAGGRS